MSCEKNELACLKKKLELRDKKIKKLKEENKVLIHIIHGDFESLSINLQKKYKDW